MVMALMSVSPKAGMRCFLRMDAYSRRVVCFRQFSLYSFIQLVAYDWKSCVFLPPDEQPSACFSVRWMMLSISSRCVRAVTHWTSLPNVMRCRILSFSFFLAFLFRENSCGFSPEVKTAEKKIGGFGKNAFFPNPECTSTRRECELVCGG